jgi:ATP-dependent Clp protease protease subunit
MNLLYKNPYLEEGEEEEEEEEEIKSPKEEHSPFILKKMEQLFLKSRSVYLWGPVEDRSAREVVSKYCCWMQTNLERRSSFTLIALVEW